MCKPMGSITLFVKWNGATKLKIGNRVVALPVLSGSVLSSAPRARCMRVCAWCGVFAWLDVLHTAYVAQDLFPHASAYHPARALASTAFFVLRCV